MIFMMIWVIVLMSAICYLLKDISSNSNIDTRNIENSFKELENSLNELGKSLDRAIEVAQAQSHQQ